MYVFDNKIHNNNCLLYQDLDEIMLDTEAIQDSTMF